MLKIISKTFNATTVSYTHLDVYKRQAEALTQGALKPFLSADWALDTNYNGNQLALEAQANNDGDVYKRQLYHNIKANRFISKCGHPGVQFAWLV